MNGLYCNNHVVYFQIIHADLFINVCKYCPAMFNTSNELEYHENQKHAREQECECKSCFERYAMFCNTTYHTL